jgi:hypothetical protein
MAITSWKGLNQSKTTMFILEIDLASSRFSRFLSQVSNDTASIESIHDEREFDKDWLAHKSNHFSSFERKLLHI